MGRGRSLTIFLSVFATVALVVSSVAYSGVLAKKFIKADKRMQKLDMVSQKVMGELYQIDYKMNRMSKRRDRFSRQMVAVQHRAKRLARSIVKLQNRLSTQKHQLSKRLRAMYMISQEGIARAIFSSTSSLQLDQSLLYLKLISEHDLALIASYRHNVGELSRKKNELNDRVRHYLSVRSALKSEVNILAQSQNSKSKLLDKLSKARREALEKIAAIRLRAGDPELANLIDLNFFEHKGELSWPVKAPVAVGYGFVRSPRYNFVLDHSGYDFHLSVPQKVKSIFSGHVSFLGRLPGYENVVILNHGDHYYSVYAHLAKTMVTAGESVSEGQVLALASHDLYFEIRHFSDAIDPKPWLNKKRMQISVSDAATLRGGRL